jgi:hypothetical protein
LEHVDAIGCLSQRSRIERLQVIADAWTREHVGRLPNAESNLTATLIVLGETGPELTRELGFFNAGPKGTIASLIPQQGIVRILREGNARAAALIAPSSRDVVALQIADLDHEETLTTRILRSEQGVATIDKWDFAPIRWPLRLRQILRSVRASAATGSTSRLPAASGPPPAATPGTPSRPAREPAPSGRRGQMRELREQLGQPAAAAPSWLQ